MQQELVILNNVPVNYRLTHVRLIVDYYWFLQL